MLVLHAERCIGCDLCRVVCPTSCIELGPVPEIASGKLEGVPAILVNHEKCAYCGLCSVICPTGAFDFTTEPGDFIEPGSLPRFHFKPFVDAVHQGGMVRSLDEPASRVVRLPQATVKPSEGQVILRHDLLDRCDPMGCKGCLNICPTDCFWVPKKASEIQERGKITMDEDLCIHCGACKNACPESIIEVRRSAVAHDFPEPSLPWTRGWALAIQKLNDPGIAEDAARNAPIPIDTGQEAGDTGGPREEEEPAVEIPPEIKARLLDEYNKIKASLAKVNVRYWMEFKKLEPLRKELLKTFKK